MEAAQTLEAITTALRNDLSKIYTDMGMMLEQIKAVKIDQAAIQQVQKQLHLCYVVVYHVLRFVQW